MNKKTGIIIAAIVVIAAAVAALYFGLNQPVKEEESTSAAASESVTVTDTTQPKSEKATEEQTVTEELTTEAPTMNSKEYDYLKDSVWYLYDDDELTAYAFRFTGRDRVEIAYFNSDNTQGLDAKYYSTSADYEIKELEGDVVVQIADPIHENEEFMFTIQNKTLCFGKKKLEKQNKISLDAILDHFS